MTNRAGLMKSNVSVKAPQQYLKRCDELKFLVKEIWEKPIILFQKLVPKDLDAVDEKGGVYLIGRLASDEILYVGRTKNLKRRLYTNHLMGNQSTARLKKYLTADQLLSDFAVELDQILAHPSSPEYDKVTSYKLAKEFLRQSCYIKFLEIEESRIRGLKECGLAYALNVRFIEEEH